MKLNTLLFGLLMTPAALLTGCSDYEDTELESPQADANAIGAYFPESSQTAVLRPDSTFFVVQMNRATDGKAVNVTAAMTENTNNVFSGMNTSFAFAEGKQASAMKVEYKPTEFQRVDKLALQINEGKKDHIYGDGFTDLNVTFCVDYTWVNYLSTSISDKLAKELTGESESFPAKLQLATDYEKCAQSEGKSVVRIEDLFGKVQLTQGGAASVHFVLDKNNQNPQLLSDEFFDNNGAAHITMPKVFETGMTQTVYIKNKKDGKVEAAELPVMAEFINITQVNNEFTVTSIVYAVDKANSKFYKVKKVEESEKTNGSDSFSSKEDAKFENETKFSVDFPAEKE